MEIEINIVKLKKYAAECSVLYVEDDELIRTQTASFLGRFFSDIVLAEDGEIGLSKYKNRKFDVVITDINMPNMNGIDMISAIKEIEYEQKIIVTSAHNDSQYLMSLINLDVNRFVLKPFNNKQFLYVLYKIAEELTSDKENAKLQEEIINLSKRAQVIVDQVHIGIVVIQNNEVVMANRAFLEIGGFDSLETLLLEMPEIGILFDKAEDCINAISNSELMELLKTAQEKNRKVKIMKNTEVSEYQVNLTEIDNSYVLTFSDITAIHNAMCEDEHTRLPARKYLLERIELLKQKTSKVAVLMVEVSHSENIEKWFGKKSAIEVEEVIANKIREICSFSQDIFIGYFNKYQFVVIPPRDKIETVYSSLKNITLASLHLLLGYQDIKNNLELSIKVKEKELDLKQELYDIEIDLVNAFDLMLWHYNI